MINLALLGAWHVHAVHHLEDSLAHPDTTIQVVWDPDPVRGAAFAAKHDLVFEADLEAVLDRDDIDGVVVDTATADHPAVIGRALDRGKHVFTEKVLAASSEDARSLVVKALTLGLVLRVSLPRIGEAVFQTMAQAIAEGLIGSVTSSRIRFAHDGAVRSWLPRQFLSHQEACGGALIDLGAHPVYLSRTFHQALPQQVSTRLSHARGLDVEDNAVMVLDYAGGAFSVLETSFVAGFFGFSADVDGENGSLFVRSSDLRVMMRRSGSPDWIELAKASAQPKPFDLFVQDMRSGKADRANLDLALVATGIIEAGYEAARLGQAVAVVLPDVMQDAGQ